MVYIEIIYLVIYSIVCFLVVKNIFKSKVDEIYNNIENELIECSNLRNNIESVLNETKKSVVEQNRQYLLEMNKDISNKIKDLSDTVKNRRII